VPALGLKTNLVGGKKNQVENLKIETAHHEGKKTTAGCPALGTQGKCTGLGQIKKSPVGKWGGEYEKKGGEQRSAREA